MDAGARSAQRRLPDLADEIKGPRLVSWKEFFQSQKTVNSKAAADQVKNQECFALSALQALQALPTLRKHLPPDFRLEPMMGGRCVLWVLGARDGIEKRQMITYGWEELFNALDITWDVVLIGPELQKDPLGDGPRERPGRRIYTFSCLLHEADLPEHLQKPTLTFAFNTGFGSAAVYHMKPWMPTVAQLVSLRRPVLFTCFGEHEARLERQILEALGAKYTPHQQGGFEYVPESDKPLSICNRMFTWVYGTSLAEATIESSILPFIENQLNSVELLNTLRDAPTMIRIISDPEKQARTGWAEIMSKGTRSATNSLLDALDEDDDQNGGVQTIVRVTVSSLVTALRSSKLAAAMMIDMGCRQAVEKLRPWVARGHWTVHDWMLEEVKEYTEEAWECVQAVEDTDLVTDANMFLEEQAVSGKVSVHGSSVKIYREPSLASSVTTVALPSQMLTVRGHRGLWLHVTCNSSEGWLLCYSDRRAAVTLLDWGIAPWPSL